jgi:hypothetical protein
MNREGVTNRIDGYLNEVSWAMGGPFSEQQAARDELRAHIRDQVRELELAGIEVDQAVDRALADLGDASILGRSLRESRGTAPLKRPLLQPDGALILERRHTRHAPSPTVLLALAAVVLTAVVVSMIYVWP